MCSVDYVVFPFALLLRRNVVKFPDVSKGSIVRPDCSVAFFGEISSLHRENFM